MEPLNKSDFCDKRLKYKGFYCKNNLKSEASYIGGVLFCVSDACAGAIYEKTS